MKNCCAQEAALAHPPLGPDVAERVVALTLEDPPAETTRWTAAMMAKVADISASASQRIGKAYGLQPHRSRQFKLSNDPTFVDKRRDVSGFTSVRRLMKFCRSRRRTEAPAWPVHEAGRRGHHGA
ncbi:hypothetical protein FJ872_08570 [Mesorhizobium sp. B2-5-9]|nr:hypothetical protein CK225_24295 [Mesorhizobium loti]TPJ39758.1 hypothetical protein FJ432_17910 [Mesorhizobium sp. B2-6-5]TPJ45936.1 hypothetical protein FJ437_14625 [Mesorhizobium sp. B2-6-6]TPJ63879.1 hypothetical protein FJ462_22625 [Mesorhizobium sp. B2-6-7]TPJ75241.1 hypothetical protein FJ419_22670 [Mesorhizobium sp. B2-6-2]TPJ93011.1 hypothetical protein FJ489_22560 [Mesorhizobium sp. B2-5-12]TPJ94752.1 hypothetical protein FJ491_24515 [Mesorhizobium sp. B2-5-10]TPK06810.1 hypothe